MVDRPDDVTEEVSSSQGQQTHEVGGSSRPPQTEEEIFRTQLVTAISMFTQNYIVGAFKQPCTVSVKFTDGDTRKQATIKKEGGQSITCPVFNSKETVAGEVQIDPAYGKKVEHLGVKVELLGQIELSLERGHVYDFTSLVRELDVPGEIYQRKVYPFEFSAVEMPYESYNGAHVKLRYVLRVTVGRNFPSNIVHASEFWVRNISPPPDKISPIKIVYVEGKKNVVADALSRKSRVLTVTTISHHELNDMREQYAANPDFNSVIEKMQDGKAVPGQQPVQLRDDMSQNVKKAVHKALQVKTLVLEGAEWPNTTTLIFG
ncbi:hypothetical protein L7F22_033738 [Adiantum nelumboides]|nr:hypothetical protein [Adiantum nelumboides]